MSKIPFFAIQTAPDRHAADQVAARLRPENKHMKRPQRSRKGKQHEQQKHKSACL
ncbi:hypothetical protein [Parageobacillus toebii]|uniref:hypothetical protein n=1 Tax=Parageobacillus toebii TaxID=153151 RepID=UPI002815322C|nr:hypothetical protein [Parageobacillus toebii]MED4970066.1 hypothetical protein [Parageobacillus toebii]WMT18744.1 hypothetical protein RFB12_16115 [Parageobacillus toebii]